MATLITIVDLIVSVAIIVSTQSLENDTLLSWTGVLTTQHGRTRNISSNRSGAYLVHETTRSAPGIVLHRPQVKVWDYLDCILSGVTVLGTRGREERRLNGEGCPKYTSSGLAESGFAQVHVWLKVSTVRKRAPPRS